MFWLSTRSPTGKFTLYSPEQIVFKSQMGCGSGNVESTLEPLLPGLVISVSVVDFSPTPVIFPSVSRVCLTTFCSLVVPLSYEMSLKGQILTFLRLSFPFLILQSSVLAHTNDREQWTATHSTVRQRNRRWSKQDGVCFLIWKHHKRFKMQMMIEDLMCTYCTHGNVQK